MRTGKHPLTPLAAVAAGLLAGAVGTVCLDTVQYLRHRRAGGTESPLAWEFAPIHTWETAPDPGQAARRVIEDFTERKLPDSWAWPISTAAHWACGSAAAAMYGVMAGSARRPHPHTACPSAPRSGQPATSCSPKPGCTSRSGSTTRKPWPGT